MNPGNKNTIVLALLWLVLLTAPYWISHVGGYTALATRMLIFGLAAMALNFLLGFTGVLSFGHAAYFGLGAYGAGMLIKYVFPSSFYGIVAGVLLGTLAAAVIGFLIIKLRGIYFAMVTIAFAQMFYFIAFRWTSVTGGDDGLTGWSRMPIDLGAFQVDIQGDPVAYYYFVLLVFALATGGMSLLLRSPFGRTLLAIRENEQRARFLGIPVAFHVWLAFVISCFFVSLAGAMYALLNNFAAPQSFHWSLSGDIVMMAVIGGMRSFWGPLLGAVVFIALQDYISSYTENWMFILGGIFVLMVLFFPLGMLGTLRRKMS